ncbi:hypothetical protein A2U01_0061381 [Trifolium medium]|uniref:Uncharacterized protein n=1 Tax=Trifolium medium TaxID=97028 RepID=A0A392RUW0_9FABA|nr:hypothetical protein [Trifolium medium]
MVFWDLRAAQGALARRAVSSSKTKISSVSCASRRMAWRGAPLKNLKEICVTVTCASRRAVGAARQHGILRKSQHSKKKSKGL